MMQPRYVWVCSAVSEADGWQGPTVAAVQSLTAKSSAAALRWPGSAATAEVPVPKAASVHESLQSAAAVVSKVGIVWQLWEALLLTAACTPMDR